MSHIKTAISIQDTLFRKAEVIAHKLEISRSQLYAQALEFFIQRNENKQLLKRINKASGDKPDEEEQEYRVGIKNYHRRNIVGEW